MRTLADLKRRMKAVLNDPERPVKVTIYNTDGKISFDPEPAMVSKAQKNEFAVSRNGGNSWMDYGPASGWSFPALSRAERNDAYRKVTIQFIVP